MDYSEESQESLLAMVIASLGLNDFPDLLNTWLQSCLPYDNITILAYFQNHPPIAIMVENNQPKVHENFSQVYLVGAYLLDPFHELHIKNVPEGVYRLSDIAPDNFRRNQYFLDYYANTTMVDEFAFVSYPSDGNSLHVCLGRDSSSKRRFTAREIALTNRISPLVNALTSSHWKNLDSFGLSLTQKTTALPLERQKKTEGRLPTVSQNTLITHKENADGEYASSLRKVANQAHGISLSPRQAEVALLVLQGHSSVSIGLKLGISFQTVKVFRKQLYRKCKISSQAELFNLMLPMLKMLSENRG